DAARSRLVLETKLNLALLVTAAAGPRPAAFLSHARSVRRRRQSVRFAVVTASAGSIAFLSCSIASPVVRSTIDERHRPTSRAPLSRFAGDRLVQNDAFQRIAVVLPRLAFQHTQGIRIAGLPAAVDTRWAEIDILRVVLVV